MKLLNEQELEAYIIDEYRELSVYICQELAKFIQNQNKLYADKIIGNNCEGNHTDWEIGMQCTIENDLREQMRQRNV